MEKSVQLKDLSLFKKINNSLPSNKTICSASTGVNVVSVVYQQLFNYYPYLLCKLNGVKFHEIEWSGLNGVKTRVQRLSEWRGKS